MKCRFGCGCADLYVTLDRGCYCFPEDREQYLCMQHWIKLEPIGSAHAEDAYVSRCTYLPASATLYKAG